VEVFKQKKSKFWWYDFAVRGKRFRRSTGETNKNRAEKIASLKFSEICEHGDPLPRKAPTVLEVSKRFLESVDDSRLVENSKLYYHRGWRLLSKTPVIGLRLDLVTNEVAGTLRFGGAPANTNCALRTLRRLLHKAEDWKLIRRAPKIKLVNEQARSLRLDETAERKLLEAAALCKWRSKRTLERFTQVLILARDTGMRNEKELYRMRIEDLYWDQRLIHVVDSKTENGIRYVPMSDRVFTVLKTLCGTRKKGWVFASKRSESGHLTTMAAKFRQAREKAGLPKKLVLYCGRHDFGTRVLENTGNLKLVMSAMGHVDVKTAMKYQHPELGIVRSALNDSNHAVLPPSA